MTEALLVIVLLISMYATARYYPKPPRYVPIGKGEVYFMPVIVDMKSFNSKLSDFDEAFKRMGNTFKEVSVSIEEFKKAYEVDWNE